MQVSLPLVLEAVYACWAVGDIDGFMDAFADDFAYTNHMSPEFVPFAGTVHGKVAFRRQLQKISDNFDVIHYTPVQIIPRNDLIRAQITFLYRHKATGLTYGGRLRHVFQIKDQRIVKFDEFHDGERTRAFFELIASYEKSMQSAKVLDDKNGLCP